MARNGKNGKRSRSPKGGAFPVGPLVFGLVLVSVGGAVIYAMTSAPEQPQRERASAKRRAVASPTPDPARPPAPALAEPMPPAADPRPAAAAAAETPPSEPVAEAELVSLEAAPEPTPKPASEPEPEPQEPAGLAGTSAPQAEMPEREAKAGEWTLVWSDEFEYEGLPDPRKWGYEVGFVRNNELQYYTKARRENARVENGCLVIEGRKERFKNPNARGNKRAYAEYTSASVTTRHTQSWTYGKIAVRARIPTGRGTWPAIWTLGTNISQVGWPTCGEIDILENVGYDPDAIHANVHTRDYNHMKHNGRGSTIRIPRPYDDFHVYAVEWGEQLMTFSVDGRRYFTVENDGTGVGSWPFDKPQYLIINLAIGGSWGAVKGVDPSIWPQKYYIDWVRVYKEGAAKLLPPAKTARLSPGLKLSCYDGRWDALPKFQTLRPAARKRVPAFDISACGRADNFGAVFEGYVTVPKDGTYLFYTESDDGSSLYVDDELVVLNDGLHGMQERVGHVGLRAGAHKIRAEFFEQAGGEGLVVRYRGPGVTKQAIPASALSSSR